MGGVRARRGDACRTCGAYFAAGDGRCPNCGMPRQALRGAHGRDVDAIALAGAGMFGWIPKWLPASAAARRWEIADQMVDLSRLGLRPR